jgi:hypothetical protein
MKHGQFKQYKTYVVPINEQGKNNNTVYLEPRHLYAENIGTSITRYRDIHFTKSAMKLEENTDVHV